MSDKKCNECYWFSRNFILALHLRCCKNPAVRAEAAKSNYLTATPKIFADIAREYGPCGLEGKFWEPRK